MALTINHNIPALIAGRNLGTIYNSLTDSIRRLSSGLRINTAADDPAGLMTREMMRADIAVSNQGIRNVTDAVSLVQTAEGALAVIDSKLIKMRELAEQAVTSSTTTATRQMINSEYQAMAAEIDRIAAAANFNGIQLLDGTINQQNGGQGLLVHFGAGNKSTEDYYYIRTADTRATSLNGLSVGGDAHADIWSTGGYPAAAVDLTGCCGGGFASLTAPVQTELYGGFMYAYNWDGKTPESSLLDPRYIAGRYGSQNDNLEQIVAKVNQGTQSRVGVTITGTLTSPAPEYTVISLGLNEAYYVGSRASASAKAGTRTVLREFGGTAGGLVSAINLSSQNYWAMLDGSTAYIFAKQGGNYDHLKAGGESSLPSEQAKISFLNVMTGISGATEASFSMGGESWAAMEYFANYPGATYSVALIGRDAAAGSNLRLFNNSEVSGSILTDTPGLKTTALLSRSRFAEVQNAADGEYAGSNIRTQEASQAALKAVENAIIKKETVRAGLGAIASRLEATLESLTVQTDNLQAAESRISDVDIAREMTEFTKNQILAQTAASMLAQANSLSSLALALLI
ncbi:MAG: flagellin [Deltaproteobacteria bacterium]|jgi:flagellin|nr:flagellin [Deltaproteobacteria bacterium]